MKDLKLFLARVNWYYVLISVMGIALIWVSVAYSKHECRKDYKKEFDALEVINDSLTDKIHFYEIRELEESIIIDSFDNDELDSVWAIIHR